MLEDKWAGLKRETPRLVCSGCGKTPTELPEYSSAFTGEDISAEDYVWSNEGTLNVTNGHFLCNGCYIEAGMPTSPQGWIAP